MNAAAFQAEFTDWRLIKGRKVIQIVLEVPLEGADVAYQALGGMPDPGKSVWVGVARLSNPQTSEQREEAPREPAASRKSWGDLTPTQQAGMLCADKSFQKWVGASSEADAAHIVRKRCGVDSRKDIQLTTAATNHWRDIVSDYRAWQREPEVVG